MKYLLVLSVLMLTGCGEYDRQQTIAAIKECEDAKLVPRIRRDGWTGDIKDVECTLPKGL